MLAPRTVQYLQDYDHQAVFVSLYTYISSSFPYWHVFQNMSLLATCNISFWTLLLLQNVCDLLQVARHPLGGAHMVWWWDGYFVMCTFTLRTLPNTSQKHETGTIVLFESIRPLDSIFLAHTVIDSELLGCRTMVVLQWLASLASLLRYTFLLLTPRQSLCVFVYGDCCHRFFVQV